MRKVGIDDESVRAVGLRKHPREIHRCNGLPSLGMDARDDDRFQFVALSLVAGRACEATDILAQ